MIGPTLWTSAARPTRPFRPAVPAAALVLCLIAAAPVPGAAGLTTQDQFTTPSHAHAPPARRSSTDGRRAPQAVASHAPTPRAIKSGAIESRAIESDATESGACKSGAIGSPTVAPPTIAPPRVASPLITMARPAMGTMVTLHLVVAQPAEAEALAEAAFAEIERVEEALSHYRTSSEIARINRGAAAGVVTDPETFALLARAQAISRLSGGAFDITVGPLMKAWGFFRGRGHYPSPDELATARAHTGWQHVRLDAATRAVKTDQPGLDLDLGGIGKGYALDRAATVLRAAGVTAALLDSGSSSFYAIGAPPGEPGWPIRVQDTIDRTRTLATFHLRDQSLSTSGTQQQFFTANGRQYSHIIDPRTGHPVDGMAQVTVIAPTATDSDALTKVAFVLGPEKAPAILTGTNAVTALFVRDDQRPDRVVQWQRPGTPESPTAQTIPPPAGVSAARPLPERPLAAQSKPPDTPRPVPVVSGADARIVSGHAAAPARERALLVAFPAGFNATESKRPHSGKQPPPPDGKW